MLGSQSAHAYEKSASKKNTEKKKKNKKKPKASLDFTMPGEIAWYEGCKNPTRNARNREGSVGKKERLEAGIRQ